MNSFQLGVNVGLCAFSFLISIFLFVAVCSQTAENIANPRRQKYFKAMIICTLVLAVADLMSRFDGRPGVYLILSHVGNFLLFFLGPVSVMLWFQYLSEQIGLGDKESRKVHSVLSWFTLIEWVLTLASLKTGWFYYFDRNEVYVRGPYFALSCVIVLFMMIFCEAVVIINRKSVDKRYFGALTLFPAIPIIGSLLQMGIYGYGFTVNCAVYALLIVFVFVQNRSLDTDYLTGVYNRRKLDIRMQQAIKNSAEGKTFSAILIDIDQFKNINDTLGHTVGDDALEDAAGILRSSLRTNTFIARYGGDEFCVILDVDEASDLEGIIERINSNAARFNLVSGKPYKIHFSMGGAVYAPSSNMELKEFQMLIDGMMYKNKHDAEVPKG